MKKALSILLAIILCLSVFLTSCTNDEEPNPTDPSSESASEQQTEKSTDGGNNDGGNNGGGNNDGGNNDGGNDDGGNNDGGNGGGSTDGGSGGGGVLPPEIVTKTTYTLEKSYMSSAAATAIDGFFNAPTKNFGIKYAETLAPFSPKGDMGLGGTTLTSITIPVWSTKGVDENRNFTFTITVCGIYNDATQVKTANVKSYPIKISAEAYGLTPNNNGPIRRLITVDLTEYNISIKQGENLGFSGDNDTLLPLYLTEGSSGDLYQYVKNNLSSYKGFWGEVGTGDNVISDGGNALLFDFTYEKTYDNETDYKAAVQTAFNENGGKYTLDQPYWPEGTQAQVQNLLSLSSTGKNEFASNLAPFGPQKNIGLSNTKLTSITIPVYSVSTADSYGNYKFTLTVLNYGDLSKASATHKKIPIYISKSAYGLSNNQGKGQGATPIAKLITVDLTPYNIVLDADDTLAFGYYGSDNPDTLWPIWMGNANPVKTLNPTLFDKWISFYKNVGGSGTPAPDNSNMIFFDFTYERTYTSVNDFVTEAKKNNVDTVTTDVAFEKMLAAVKEAYKGKNLSVFGDSISTYQGISNSTSYNSTIGGNAVWYGSSAIAEAKLTSHLDTYWGRLLAGANMNLCVNNAWSGDSVCGGRAFKRAQNLHRDTSTMSPNLILVYYGINDTGGEGRAVGELYTLLQNKGNKTNSEVVEAWFEGVLAKAESKNFQDSWGTSYSSWSEAYALMIYLMSETYSDSKIVLFELVENGAYLHNGYVNANTLVPQYNVVINALAEYFGMPVVKQYTLIDHTNYDQYMHDYRLLHPNAAGHEVMYKELIRTLYADLNKK